MVQNGKSEMATWWPYWKSDRNKNLIWHLPRPLIPPRYEINWVRVSQVKWTQNSRWPPGGHIERWMTTEIDSAPPLIHTITPLKYEVDWPSTSLVMERNGKSEMATWWPYWKSDRDFDWPSTSLVMERNGKSEMATWWPYWKSDRD
jgi:hypothetical protein